MFAPKFCHQWSDHLAIIGLLRISPPVAKESEVLLLCLVDRSKEITERPVQLLIRQQDWGWRGTARDNCFSRTGAPASEASVLHFTYMHSTASCSQMLNSQSDTVWYYI
jgi:hypothetical protein